MSYFDTVSPAPPDPILSLTEAYQADPNPQKANLSVGVFVDENGKTPILETVKAAEQSLLQRSKSKSYLPMLGTPGFARETAQLCFGSPLAESIKDRIASLHTPGGTGALRVAADFIARNTSTKTVWVSDPTWANHKGIFSAAGLNIQAYPYFDQASLTLDYAALISALKQIPQGDLVVLHGCCHNPTGADLAPEQWAEVAAIAAAQKWIPLVDFAYQGFGTDMDEDAAAARAFAASGADAIVCQSFSKNLGLYQDRTGALHVLSAAAQNLPQILSQLKVAVRVNYSNPPAHGGAIVGEVLSQPVLKQAWIAEVAAMRERIAQVRLQLVDALEKAGAKRDFSFLVEQRGMFSFTGLSKEQAIALRREHSVYIVDSGRINVAGITANNLERVANAIKSVL